MNGLFIYLEKIHRISRRRWKVLFLNNPLIIRFTLIIASFHTNKMRKRNYADWCKFCILTFIYHIGMVKNRMKSNSSDCKQFASHANVFTYLLTSSTAFTRRRPAQISYNGSSVCKRIRSTVAKRPCDSERVHNQFLISLFFQANIMKFFESTKCCFCVTDLDVAGYVIGGYMILGVLNYNYMPYFPAYINLFLRTWMNKEQAVFSNDIRKLNPINFIFTVLHASVYVAWIYGIYKVSVIIIQFFLVELTIFSFVFWIETSRVYDTGADHDIRQPNCYGDIHSLSHNCRHILSWCDRVRIEQISKGSTFQHASWNNSHLFCHLDHRLCLHRFVCSHFHTILSNILIQISFGLVIHWHLTSVMCSVLKKIREEVKELHLRNAPVPLMAWKKM